MRRDFVVVVGGQGCGKSVWTRQLTAPCKRLFVYDPMRSYVADFEWSEQTGERILSRHVHSFRIGSDSADDVPLLFDMAYAAGNCTLLIEESGALFAKRAILGDSIRRVIFMGRHRQVNLILIAQRAVSIPIDMRSQANRFVCFRQIEEQDINAVCALIGRKYREVIPALPELRCLDWKNGQVTAYPLHVGNKHAIVTTERSEIDHENSELNNEDDENA